MKRFLLLAVAVVGLSVCAMATVCTFDDLTGQGPVPDGYCGITWGGVWTYYGFSQPPYNPESPPNRIYSPNTGAGEYRFTLNTPSVFNGAFFAGYGFAAVNFNLYDSMGNLLWTSATLDPSATPTWLASGYSGVVSQVGVFSSANDFYVMDNVTYGGTTTVPEPGSLALLGSGLLAAVGVVRRRFN